MATIREAVTTCVKYGGDSDEAGKGQLVRVTFDAKGKSTEAPESEWLDGDGMIAEVEKRLAAWRVAK